jgi:hypothetical protein
MNKFAIDNVRKHVTNNNMSTNGPPIGMDLPKKYIESMTALGEKYREVRWLPLDIPKIEFDDFKEFEDLWAKECIDVLRIKPDVAEPWEKEKHPYGINSSWHVSQFQGLTIWRHPDSETETLTFAEKWYKGNFRQFNRIVEQVFEYFPVHTMLSVFIWKSTMEVKPHRDKSAFWNCPTEFRTMLYDENEDPTLYVADIEHGDVNYIDLPEDTNSFCWSNGTQIHGSDYHGKNKYLLCLSCVQHSKKSDELFERSIKKYRNKLNYELKIDL